jgi:hypothetical protein
MQRVSVWWRDRLRAELDVGIVTCCGSCPHTNGSVYAHPTDYLGNNTQRAVSCCMNGCAAQWGRNPATGIVDVDLLPGNGDEVTAGCLANHPTFTAIISTVNARAAVNAANERAWSQAKKRFEAYSDWLRLYYSDERYTEGAHPRAIPVCVLTRIRTTFPNVAMPSPENWKGTHLLNLDGTAFEP